MKRSVHALTACFLLKCRFVGHKAAEDLERIGRLIQRDKPIAAKILFSPSTAGSQTSRIFPIAGAADVSRAHAS